ncbi:hypothetical protein HYH03_011222 [Edaphochlamys debaryana]|uniref:Sodium/calcium exchanger membrane region domain-containing protein n=1 Tax=Edaphochlamys debaryana TaxID=47281 RepID=A0A835XV73_9CHLO|nr:hypothetical protein HYH03_011222 [Edaphochlamys debaryana]|eukprot:KAG2490267.1 hypothetical protein HYH03_011222 [Edaphochlamys debaryana]
MSRVALVFVALLLGTAAASFASEDGDSQPQPSPSPQPEPQPQQEPQQEPEYSCEQLNRVPAAQRCAFVRAECEEDSVVPYTQLYYCHVAPHGVIGSFFFTLLLACLLPLLFTLLGDTAEVYFSPIMTHVSQSIPKLRPRFAGVTFVAIGNGAPDLSANISAIRNGGVLLSAGALTGAAMFVQCVVASEVMRASRARGPVKCRGATLRDVAAYSAAVLMVLAWFAHGRISRWFIVTAALLYGTYVAWVFAGDEWHDRGRPHARTVWRALRGAWESRFGRRAEAEGLLPWASVDLGAEELGSPLPSGALGRLGSTGSGGPLAATTTNRPNSPGSAAQLGAAGPGGARARRQGSGGGTGTGPGGPHPHHHLVSSKAYQRMVWADINPEEGVGDGSSRHAARRRRRGGRGGGGGGAGAGAGSGPRVAAGPAAVAGSSLELGPKPSAGAGAGGSSSALVTLSSADGSALPAPAPVDAAPTWGSSGVLQPAGSGSALGPAGSGSGLAAPGLGSVGRLAPWGVGPSAAGGGGGSDDGGSYVGSSSEDEEAGLLAAHAGRKLRRGSREGSGEDEDEEEEGEGEDGGERRAPRTLWERVQFELTVGNSAEWEELPPESLRARWRAVTFPMLLPVYAALRLTIPFVDPSSYSRPWLIATCACAPLLAATYLATGSLAAFIVAACVGAALAAAVAFFTAGEEDALPDWTFGTSFAFGPALFAVFGFFMGVIWIDTLASEVVGVISLLAGVLRIPPSVMGLTLLAWGNSLGDYFGNIAMAKRGQPTMALTACFAGPLFNMLASMALGFGSYFARHHVGAAAVELRPEVALGCVFLVLYNAAVAAAGLLNKGVLPDRFYLFARAWYGLYFVAAFILGLTAGEG